MRSVIKPIYKLCAKFEAIAKITQGRTYLFCYGMQLNLGKVQRPFVTRYIKLFYNVLKLLLATVEQHEFMGVYKLDSFHLNLISFKL